MEQQHHGLLLLPRLSLNSEREKYDGRSPYFFPFFFDYFLGIFFCVFCFFQSVHPSVRPSVSLFSCFVFPKLKALQRAVELFIFPKEVVQTSQSCSSRKRLMDKNTNIILLRQRWGGGIYYCTIQQ
jgi:hypothetical protein